MRYAILQDEKTWECKCYGYPKGNFLRGGMAYTLCEELDINRLKDFSGATSDDGLVLTGLRNTFMKRDKLHSFLMRVGLCGASVDGLDFIICKEFKSLLDMTVDEIRSVPRLLRTSISNENTIALYDIILLHDFIRSLLPEDWYTAIRDISGSEPFLRDRSYVYQIYYNFETGMWIQISLFNKINKYILSYKTKDNHVVVRDCTPSPTNIVKDLDMGIVLKDMGFDIGMLGDDYNAVGMPRFFKIDSLFFLALIIYKTNPDKACKLDYYSKLRSTTQKFVGKSFGTFVLDMNELHKVLLAITINQRNSFRQYGGYVGNGINIRADGLWGRLQDYLNE